MKKHPTPIRVIHIGDQTKSSEHDKRILHFEWLLNSILHMRPWHFWTSCETRFKVWDWHDLLTPIRHNPQSLRALDEILDFPSIFPHRLFPRHDASCLFVFAQKAITASNFTEIDEIAVFAFMKKVLRSANDTWCFRWNLKRFSKQQYPTISPPYLPERPFGLKLFPPRQLVHVKLLLVV